MSQVERTAERTAEPDLEAELRAIVDMADQTGRQLKDALARMIDECRTSKVPFAGIEEILAEYRAAIEATRRCIGRVLPHIFPGGESIGMAFERRSREMDRSEVDCPACVCSFTVGTLGEHIESHLSGAANCGCAA